MLTHTHSSGPSWKGLKTSFGHLWSVGVPIWLFLLVLCMMVAEVCCPELSQGSLLPTLETISF